MYSQRLRSSTQLSPVWFPAFSPSFSTLLFVKVLMKCHTKNLKKYTLNLKLSISWSTLRKLKIAQNWPDRCISIKKCYNISMKKIYSENYSDCFTNWIKNVIFYCYSMNNPIVLIMMSVISSLYVFQTSLFSTNSL